jgi:hypothetical protein
MLQGYPFCQIAHFSASVALDGLLRDGDERFHSHLSAEGVPDFNSALFNSCQLRSVPFESYRLQFVKVN